MSYTLQHARHRMRHDILVICEIHIVTGQFWSICETHC